MPYPVAACRGTGIVTPSAAAFSPADIPGLQLWLRADGTLWQDSARTTPAVADSDPVGAWDDASGNGRHATQTTSTRRLTLKAGVQNGLPVLRLDGVDDFLAVADAAGLQFGTGDFAAFAVFRSSNVAKGDISQNTVLSKNFTGWETLLYNSQQNNFIGGTPNPVNGSVALTDNVWYSQSLRRIGASCAARLNGVNNGSATNSANVSNAGTNLQIGQRPSGSSATFLVGDVAEILVYGGTISDGNRQNVETYLNQKWSIY